MPVFERNMHLFTRVLSLLRVPGDGPLMLRIGGDSTDHALLEPNVRRAPRGIFELTPTWFRDASVVVRALAARTILDLNLVTDLPRMAAQWANAAQAQLPPGSVAAYEIGNEPDLYNPAYWERVLSPIARLLDIRLFTSGLSPSTYIRRYVAYAQALAKFAPNIPLAAPVLAYPVAHLDWIASMLAIPHPGLGLVTAHEYPYSACAPPMSASYPTITRLLSTNATAGMAESLRPAIALAHGAGYPFRLTELNSVTCGGVAGVSDTFATALWAPDALFELARAGADGVNVHVRAYAVNAAFAMTTHGVVARPLLYGLILFARTLGPDPQLIDARTQLLDGARLHVWAVRVGGDVLHVLLINKSNHPVNAELRLPVAGRAKVERLLAPSVTAREGVTLGGQQLGPDDHWLGRPANETIAPGPGGYELTVPSTSAALLDVHLRPGPLGAPSGPVRRRSTADRFALARPAGSVPPSSAP
jgi:hypothetical protein